MNLTPLEREKITDSLLKIQSARATLEDVDDTKYPNAEEIESCLESAGDHLKTALGYGRPQTAVKPASDRESSEK